MSSICHKVIISNIFNNLNDGDIVISPGDSPSKVIKIIQTVFGNNDNYVFNNNGISTVKHIKFINFPISSVSSYVDPIVIDSYLLSILKANNVSSLNNLKYLDFIEGGGSYRNIVSSLQRITNSSYVIPAINLSNFQPSDENCKDALKLLFDVSEATQSRCLPNFNLYETRPLPANSILRCNVVIAMISLLLLGKLQF